MLTAPQAAVLARLDTIPGVARRTAEVIVAELGCDMSRFPTAGHAASWAGLCRYGRAAGW
jgi:transposase